MWKTPHVTDLDDTELDEKIFPNKVEFWRSLMHFCSSHLSNAYTLK